MFVVRPVKLEDLDAVERFAYSISLGMLSLPKDRELLYEKITKSLHSFSANGGLPKNEFYLFVLEDTLKKEAVGTCGIYSKTGVTDPLYYYRIKTVKRKKSHLPLPEEMKILYPICEKNGPAELCALYIEKELRKEGLGQLLSLCRFLFIKEQRSRFEKTILARLRGFINKSGMTSPFWEDFGKKFLRMEFKDVQDLHQRGTQFISDFLPIYPIYKALLPKSAQYVIQKTQITTRPALKMLKKEGFLLTDQIDIFEAGPVLKTDIDSIRSVKESVLAKICETTDTDLASCRYILSNTSLDFRACYGCLKICSDGSVIIKKEVAQALSVEPGQKIRYITTH